jgi:hypothetical protein
MKEFTQETIEAIGSYVYALIDPRKSESHSSRIFYVGKGVGNRCFSHAEAETRWKAGEPNPKLGLIREIRKATGKPPPVSIIAHRLTEGEAHRLEAALISTLQTDCNLVRGKYADDYYLTTAELEGRHSCPLHESELGHRVLLVNLNGGDELPSYPDTEPEDFPRRVLMYWPLSDRNADQVEYIIGVYRQVTRIVFKTRRTADGRAVYERIAKSKKKNGHPNWKRAFAGERSIEKELIWCNRRIIAADGRIATKFPRQVGCQLIGKHSQR